MNYWQELMLVGKIAAAAICLCSVWLGLIAVAQIKQANTMREHWEALKGEMK